MLKLVSLIFIVLIGCVVGIDEDANPCPDHWIRATFVDMGCLYVDRTATVTWEEANQICQEIENQNAFLVEILTEEQMDFLAMELDAIDEGTNNYWIGGTDKGREGQWFWISSLKAVGDFVWRSGEPSSGTKYNCASLHSGDDYLAWDNYLCSTNDLYPICQIYI